MPLELSPATNCREHEVCIKLHLKDKLDRPLVTWRLASRELKLSIKIYFLLVNTYMKKQNPRKSAMFRREGNVKRSSRPIPIQQHYDITVSAADRGALDSK
ncbi:hypothetical protein MAP00_002133 [Monascus purpureus]|nr:hypothetical protein MAP00_002133 [Monascus purpureus]